MKRRYTKINIGGKKYSLNIEPSPIDKRDYTAEAIFHPLTEEGIPEEFDLRNELLEIRDQGSQGTCLAFSVSCMKEWEEKKARELLEILIKKKAVQAYPILIEVNEQRVAQAEHTFIPLEEGVKVTTRI